MADAALSNHRMDATRMTKLSPTSRKFIRDWGELADRWGVDRTTAEVHALLYVSKVPMDIGAIADALAKGADDTQVGLDALRAMGVVQLAARNAGSLRYECLPDVWEMFRAILEERRRREVEPAVATLRDALLRADNDPECDEHTRRRLEDMQLFLRDSLGLCKQFSSMPGPEVRRLLKMGGKIRKALGLAD
ncbi:MAG: hypothetical protein K8T90_02130 [Planctomycetes bacterium]|nr:hypothetical protein [Planctomycetota bacterium]